MPSRPMTLIEHITKMQRESPGASGSFTVVMHALALACKIVASEVDHAGLGQQMGLSGRRNVQGEDVARLDEFSNEALVRTLTRCGSVCAIGSEELAVPIRLPSNQGDGDYAVVFDPLDGSSNIDVAVSVGTIFGVYRRVTPAAGLGGLSDLLQPAGRLVAAGYAIYGSSTVFVFTTGRGVNGFTLDPSLGEFLLSHPEIRIPEQGKTFSANLSNKHTWSPGDRLATATFVEPGDARAPYSLRYVGSLVADAHRTLLKGGLFVYPADQEKPQGKLRLLYEAGPLARIFEEAGGAASDGTMRILDRAPQTLHDRTPLVLGSRLDVARYLARLRSDEA